MNKQKYRIVIDFESIDDIDARISLNALSLNVIQNTLIISVNNIKLQRIEEGKEPVRIKI